MGNTVTKRVRYRQHYREIPPDLSPGLRGNMNAVSGTWLLRGAPNAKIFEIFHKAATGSPVIASGYAVPIEVSVVRQE